MITPFALHKYCYCSLVIYILVLAGNSYQIYPFISPLKVTSLERIRINAVSVIKELIKFIAVHRLGWIKSLVHCFIESLPYRESSVFSCLLITSIHSCKVSAVGSAASFFGR